MYKYIIYTLVLCKQGANFVGMCTTTAVRLLREILRLCACPPFLPILRRSFIDVGGRSRRSCIITCVRPPFLSIRPACCLICAGPAVLFVPGRWLQRISIDCVPPFSYLCWNPVTTTILPCYAGPLTTVSPSSRVHHRFFFP